MVSSRASAPYGQDCFVLKIKELGGGLKWPG